MLSAIAKKFSRKEGKKRKTDPSLDWKKKNQALVYLIKSGKRVEARELAEELVEYVERVFPKDAPEKATTYSNMGMVLMLERDFDLAEECFREALTMRKRLMGERHKEVAVIYLNLIELYKIQAREILLETREMVQEENN